MTSPDDPVIPVVEFVLTSGRRIALDALGHMGGTLAITVDDTAKTGRSFRFKMRYEVAAQLAAGIAAYEQRRLATRAAFAADREGHARRVEAARARLGPTQFGAAQTKEHDPDPGSFVPTVASPSIDPRDLVVHRPGRPRGRCAP